MIKRVLFFIKYSFILFLFVSAGALLPREIKGPFPYAWGYLEGSFNRDMTGWWFSSYQGEGNCRIVNGREAFSHPGARIIFGLVYPPNEKPYPHLWALNDNGKVLDDVCPLDNPSCKQRRVLAVIDAKSLKVLSRTPASEMERKQIAWGVKYLDGLKSGMGVKDK
jgi:hypothetical protein